ncbi:hypothetical protein F5141DRAFT_1211659 [Pisolithus sp. B1]|nr:hypothetical protein F5141DRAFT_1211659 [Pisolithus sp. B1]
MHWAQDWVGFAKESVITLMEEYHCFKVPEDVVLQSSSQPNLLDVLAQHFNIGDIALGMPRHRGQQSMQEEYQLYMEGAYILETTDPLKFWEISPILMEALQMLKYHLKQEWLDFLVNWAVSPASLTEDEPKESADGMKKYDIHVPDLETLLNKSVAEDGDKLLVDVEIIV